MVAIKLLIFSYPLVKIFVSGAQMNHLNAMVRVSTQNIFNCDIRNFISHITSLCSLLHSLLKDKYMCLQDEWKL